MNVAVFTAGPCTQGYRQYLSRWQSEAIEVYQFNDARSEPSDKSSHYLNFYWRRHEAHFSSHIYAIGDDRESAALFPFFMRFPGIIFLESLSLRRFIEAVSHSLEDPAGTGMLLNQAGLENHDWQRRLIKIGAALDLKPDSATIPAVLARCSPLLVVKDSDDACQLERLLERIRVVVCPHEDVPELMPEILAYCRSPKRAMELQDAEKNRKLMLESLPDIDEQQIRMARGQFSREFQVLTEPVEVAFQKISGRISFPEDSGEQQ